MPLPPHAELVRRLAALAGRPREVIALEGVRLAAVAVLLVERDGLTRVTLTVRSTELVEHSGQVSLPGGRMDGRDESLIATALRETNEELGIGEERVRVLGEANDVVTSTGYVMTPVVCELDVPVYAANPAEVAQVFEAPLALFTAPEQAEYLGERLYKGIRYPMRAYAFEGQRIWGATARVLEQVAETASASARS